MFVLQFFSSLWWVIVRYPFLAKRERGKRDSECVKAVLATGPVMHRGGIPENTIRGFQESKTKGATSVEVDLQFTKDGHPILIHDDTVDRTSDGTGTVKDMTLEEIKRLDVGVKFGHPGVNVPTLDEAIQSLRDLQLFLFLEVKASNSLTIPTLLELFQSDESLYDRVAVISFFPDVLYNLSQLDPKIRTGYTSRGTFLASDPLGNPRFKQVLVHKTAEVMDRLLYWTIRTFFFNLVNPTLLLPHKDDVLNKRLDIERYRKEGAVVLTWTVNDISEQRHLSEVLRVPYMKD